MESLRAFLEFMHGHPQLQTLGIAVATFVVLYLWRRWAPASFEKLPQTLREFPAVFVGALIAWATTQVEALQSAITAGDGAFAGVAAIGLHWFLKNTPWISYGNTPKDDRRGSLGSGAAGSLLVMLVPLLLLGSVTSCTPAQRAGLPVLSTVDAIGIQVAHAMQWCDDHGVDQDLVQKVKHAADAKDFPTTIALLRKGFEVAAKNGQAVPAEIVATVDVLEQALAAQAVGEAMRALSTDAAKPAPAPSEHPAQAPPS